MFSAAVLPWLKATSQCSMRIGRPWTAESYSQMSPAANTPGAELRSRDVAAHAAALADLQARPDLASVHVRHHARADDHERPRSSSRPPR